MAIDPLRRYTGVWHAQTLNEAPWIRDMLGPYLAREVVDLDRTFVEDRTILFDIYANAQDQDYYRRFRGLDAFLFDISDEHYEFLPEMYTNFRGIIRCHWSDVFLPEAIKIIPLGYPDNLVRRQECRKALDRQFIWSFVGQLAKSSRPDVARHLAHIEPHLLFSTDDERHTAMWNRTRGGAPRRYSAEQNSALLADTIFAPSPMGNTNLECFRVYEALELGCIPLVERRLTLDLFREKYGSHPMPTFRSWRQARHFVEHMMRRPEEMDDLQSACMAWWAETKTNCRAGLGEFLARRSAVEEQPRLDQLFKPRHAWPGFTVLELLRHHDVWAMGRRVEGMARRLLTTRQLRVHHRPATGPPRR